MTAIQRLKSMVLGRSRREMFSFERKFTPFWVLSDGEFHDARIAIPWCGVRVLMREMEELDEGFGEVTLEF